MSSECKGCKSYRKNQVIECFAGVKPHFSETEHCPCIICLVKSMCSSGCEAFQNYKSLNRAKMGYEYLHGRYQQWKMNVKKKGLINGDLLMRNKYKECKGCRSYRPNRKQYICASDTIYQRQKYAHV